MKFKSELLKAGAAPRYAEITLLSVALTFGLLYATNPTMRTALSQTLAGLPAWAVIVSLGLSVAVVVAALFNTLRFRPKKPAEDRGLWLGLMLVEAVIALGAGQYALAYLEPVGLLFPFLCLLNALGLALFLPRPPLEARPVPAEQVKLFEVIAAFAATLILFTLGQYILGYTWPITLALVGAFSISASELLKRWLDRLSAKAFSQE